jgi:hypothetical protein
VLPHSAPLAKTQASAAAVCVSATAAAPQLQYQQAPLLDLPAASPWANLNGLKTGDSLVYENTLECWSTQHCL